jgi:magnesium-transporting ATPase (P-type)
MPAILDGSLKGFEPHQLSAEELPRRLQVDPAQGLLTEEARRRLVEHGPNELKERSARKPWAILWDQLSATMVLVLLAAAAISFALRDAKDAIAILTIVALNAALGFVQEYRAEKAMAALKKTRRCRALRCGATAKSNLSRRVIWCAATSFIWRRVIWSEPTAGSLRQKA